MVSKPLNSVLAPTVLATCEPTNQGGGVLGRRVCFNPRWDGKVFSPAPRGLDFTISSPATARLIPLTGEPYDLLVLHKQIRDSRWPS